MGELAEETVKYLGVLSCAYQIGGFTLNKDAVLFFDDDTNEKQVDYLLDSLSENGYFCQISRFHNAVPFFGTKNPDISARSISRSFTFLSIPPA